MATSPVENNTTELQSILSAINNLPDSSSLLAIYERINVLEQQVADLTAQLEGIENGYY